MARTIFVMFALLAYTIFFVTFLYLIAFVGDLPWVSKTVDRGMTSGIPVAPAIDLALVALFGVQHSVMARRGFKAAWTRFVPPPIERSVYVLAASVVLILLFMFWQPIGATVWSVNGAGAAILWTVFAAGWLLVLLSTFLINHFELFGLSQVILNWRGARAADPRFRQPFFYRLVRHPLYSGFILAFWSTPHMSAGHLLLALGMTAYILVAIRYEERDLVHLFGPDYEAYQQRVGMLLPRMKRSV
jgi:protein-S-isoprenylcysteine O-methyltransferase Ste14